VAVVVVDGAPVVVDSDVMVAAGVVVVDGESVVGAMVSADGRSLDGVALDGVALDSAPPPSICLVQADATVMTASTIANISPNARWLPATNPTRTSSV
jgi:hypothetical protein